MTKSEKISEASKKRWQDPEYRARLSAKLKEQANSGAGKAQRSKQSKKAWSDAEYRGRVVGSLTAALATPEAKQKCSDASKLGWIVSGRKEEASETQARLWTEEKRASVGKESKRLWQDADYVGKTVSALRLNGLRPEFREAARREALSRWQRQEYRNKVTLANLKKWEDQDYRQRVTASVNTAEGLALISTKLKEKWLDAAYRDSIISKWRLPEFQAKMAKVRANYPAISSLNRIVSSILSGWGIEHTLEHAVGPWNFDVFVPSRNLLIECQGEYWHSLPRAIRNDRAKETYVKSYFPELRLRKIWEVEFYKEGRVEFLLGKLCGRNEDRAGVTLSELAISLTEPSVAKNFYGLHHYLGSARGTSHYGLIWAGKLIGACSFGPFQRNEQTKKYGKEAIELTRFCLDPEYQVKNLGSWFLSRCLKLVGKTVVTYADTTQGHDGALYKACNFRFSHEVDPDYFYVDQDGWVLHKKTAWNRASAMKVSEAEYAAKHGLSKKWGGVKLCFIKDA